MTYVTDTHPLVWYLDQSSTRLSPAARQVFRDKTAQIVIPTIVLVEIKFLFSRSRIAVNLPTALAYVAAVANCTLCALDDAILDHLPTTLNIHDAIIVGTALVYREVRGEQVALITKDAEITASGLVPVLW
jgi:PIN domain nuclease of toxin-antitoxin system